MESSIELPIETETQKDTNRDIFSRILFDYTSVLGDDDKAYKLAIDFLIHASIDNRNYEIAHNDITPKNRLKPYDVVIAFNFTTFDFIGMVSEIDDEYVHCVCVVNDEIIKKKLKIY